MQKNYALPAWFAGPLFFFRWINRGNGIYGIIVVSLITSIIVNFCKIGKV